MKVVYFSLDYTTHDYRILSSLSETDHKVFYVRLQSGARQKEHRPIPKNVEQVQWLGGRSEFHWSELPRLVIDFTRLLRKIRPDLVHAGPIQDVGLITALAGFHPLLSMSWGFDLLQDADRNAFYRGATAYVLHRTDVFVSDCEATRERAIAFGVPRERTFVFPWGVDLEQFNPRQPAIQVQGQKKGFTLLCNRSWEPRYGLDVLAKAFVCVARANRKDVSLLLLGEGSLSKEIKHIFTHNGVSELVAYGGRIPQVNLPPYYHQADMFISPSHVDGSSVSLLEAMACGMPVLVSDIPTNREWVSDGMNGWLFPDGDYEALAAKILQVLDDQKSMRSMGKAARATIEKRADWKKNFPKLLEAYQLAVTLRKE